ncbi:MAG TPA: radical SAM protein [Candidatus Cloacimonadota bacterium]|nr:radical SAM protein [Candidatus Cloacimonadota bacterium]
MKILPIFIPHQGCPFHCIYCNQKTITKTDGSAFDRLAGAIRDFCRQNKNEFREVAFFGGTFTNLPLTLQQKYCDLVEPFSDECSIRLSTRPDAVSSEQLAFCRSHHVQTIELGIQSFHDRVLQLSQRHYTSADAVAACRRVKESGFVLGIQLMPGLPGFSAETWQQTMANTLNLQPSYVRIYPTIVLKRTALESLFAAGKYTPLSLDDSIRFTAMAVQKFEAACIKIIKLGLHSDIASEEIVAGPYHQSFGELVRSEILMQKIIPAFRPQQTLHLCKKDVSLFKGFGEKMLRELKTQLKIARLPVCPDENVEKGNFLFTETTPCDYW